MSDEENTSDKPYEPTQKRLDDARKKGEVAKSTDLSVAAAYAGLSLVALAFGGTLVAQTSQTLSVLLDQASDISDMIFADPVVVPPAAPFWNLALSLAPVFAVPAAVIILTIIAQRAFVFAPSKLAPKLSRIDIFKNGGNKFGRSGLFEFAKSAAKLCLFSVCLGSFLYVNREEIATLTLLEPALAAAQIGHMGISFLLLAFLIAAAIGGIDAIWQRVEHLRKNRMSHDELKKESKESEGDPHLKQARRQKAIEITSNQMLGDVAQAAVVITNPTHFAVALKWNRDTDGAPICVAKGVDHVAAAIREKAQEAGVPIHRDPPTARALHATTDVGSEIPPDTYRAVAAAIRFAEAMKAKTRKGWGK